MKLRARGAARSHSETRREGSDGCGAGRAHTSVQLCVPSSSRSGGHGAKAAAVAAAAAAPPGLAAPFGPALENMERIASFFDEQIVSAQSGAFDGIAMVRRTSQAPAVGTS